MLKNYIKISLRNLKKNKAHSLINIAGLALGLACCVLILLYVRDELSYDRYHEHADDIYRVERDIVFHEQQGRYPVTAHPFAAALKNEFPEIEEAVRIWPTDTDFLDQNQQYNRARLIYADASVFDVFTWSFIDGDPATALTEPYAVVLTRSLAERYFPDQNPLGQTLTMQWGQDYDLKVTGVIEDIPENSHFRFDALASYATAAAILGEEQMNVWFSNNTYTYLRLQEGYPSENLEAKLPDWQEKYMGSRAREMMGPETDINEFVQLKLNPLTDIHLYSNLEHEIEPNSDVATVYIFSAVALLILLIACINFMNLSTARSIDRAREVGLRKVVGAARSRLIVQFLSESVVMTALALVLAVGLIELLLPLFGSLTGKELAIRYLENPLVFIGFIALALCVGIFAGSYPAFFLSAFQPVTVLKGSLKAGSKGALLRKSLVVAQFAISTALIVGTVVVMQQLDYLRSKKLGFDKQHTVVIPLRDANLRPSHVGSLKEEIRQNHSVVNVATGNRVPGNRQFSDTMFRKARTGDHVEDMINLQYFHIGYEYLPTLGVHMAAGRNFSPAFSTDSSSGFIINQAAVQKLGWGSAQEAVGKEFARATAAHPPLTFKEGQIIGVTEDFHFKSLHQRIEPIVLELNPNAYRYVLVRIQPENIAQTLAFLQGTIQTYSPTYPFDYFFVDDYFDNLYRSEERLREIFSYFTFLAIFIACLGLFGLASFATARRTKEIGIRKVLGATVAGIVALLARDFVKLVVLAFVIATPLAYWAMESWLTNFAYHIEIGWWMFVLAGAVALLIAILTVSTQAVRAALSNPVESLRYE